MQLRRQVNFEVTSLLDRDTGVEFVRDVERSLAAADFLTALTVGDDDVVSAHLPVNASLFGQQRLRFASRLVHTVTGGRLEGLVLDDVPGWARVSGEAVVVERVGGCLLDYRFDIEIHLAVPDAESWGGKALGRMIEVTADRVLSRIAERFPEAVRASARAYEEMVAA